LQDAVGGGGVHRHERVQRIPKHGQREVAHSRKINERFDRWVRQVTLCGLGNVHGEVADALEIGVDPKRRHDGAQIDGDRVEQRQQRKTALVDIYLRVVELAVAGDDLIQRVTISGRQSLKRGAHPPLGDTPHDQDAISQRLQLLSKVSRLVGHGAG